MNLSSLRYMKSVEVKTGHVLLAEYHRRYSSIFSDEGPIRTATRGTHQNAVVARMLLISSSIAIRHWARERMQEEPKQKQVMVPFSLAPCISFTLDNGQGLVTVHCAGLWAAGKNLS